MRVFILVLELLVFCNAATSLSSDGWALIHFRASIVEDPEHALLNWNVYDQDPCSWAGVSCEDGKITSLNLSGLSLKGALSPELGQLNNLRELILRGNGLMGFIPFQLGELGKLEVLDLAHNQLSGHLPEDLGNLSSLSRLYLENNMLEGIIPAELGALGNLCELTVSVNKLTGIIPGGLYAETEIAGFHGGSVFETGFCKLKYLRVADFSSNYFEGDLPACLHHLPSESFSFNCLGREGRLHQRPTEDCTKMPYSVVGGRRLLQTDGSAGVNGTSYNETNPTPFIISDGSPTASPSPAPVQVGTPLLAPAAATLTSPSPVASSEVVPDPSAGTEASSSSSHKRQLAVVIPAAIAAFVVIAGVIFLCCRRKSIAVRPWKGSMSGELQKGFTKGVPAFSRVELEAACEDFSNIIGFSPDIVLFKGTLANKVEIAVTSIRKSAKSWSSNSELIFWKKVESLSRMKHQNLINLLGYCAEEEPFIRMLVFEYVPNGTVHEHLHSKFFVCLLGLKSGSVVWSTKQKVKEVHCLTMAREQPSRSWVFHGFVFYHPPDANCGYMMTHADKESEHLDWETRMRIVMGVAYALDYMHHGFDSPLTHTRPDTKSVFLSEDFSAKVADFGVWKVSNAQKDSKASNERANILGHEELELSDRLIPHLETNIYDFGVFLLEMVSGKPPHSKEVGSVVEWALSCISSPGQLACIVDPTLESYNLEELEVVTRIAYECLHPDSSITLTMRQISLSLSSSLSSIKNPILPKSSPLLWAELQILSQD